MSIAQLLMPSLIPKLYLESEEYRAQCTTLIEEGVGGFCVFQGELEQTSLILAELQAQADEPLLFSADYEHGLPMRLDGGTDFPHAMALGVGGDVTLTRSVAQAIARECAALGVHWNFAPVCDINSNRQNPIINTRAFGESIADVIPHSVAFINGTQSENVAACAKHFPGHGDTSVDSHIEMPVLHHDKERLSSVELVPFLAAVRAGVKSIMIGHLAVPAFDSTNTPASLSKPIVSLLREKFAYNGIIITDALDMHAIQKRYSSAEATVQAITAGCDIALIPEHPIEALAALRDAERDGRIPTEQIAASVERVRLLKEWCGLYQRKAQRREPISLEAHGMMALKAATNAVRVNGDESRLPLEQYNHISCFALLQTDDIDPASTFFHYVAQVYEKNTDIAYMTAAISHDEIEEYKRGIAGTECCVFAVFARARSYAGSVQLDPNLLDAVHKIAEGKPTIAVLFGNPYLAETFPADVFVTCYSDSAASRGAACLALSGKSLTI